MADCTCNPEYPLTASECDLPLEVFQRHFSQILEIAPNPFEVGRKNMRESLRRTWWC